MYPKAGYFQYASANFCETLVFALEENFIHLYSCIHYTFVRQEASCEINEILLLLKISFLQH